MPKRLDQKTKERQRQLLLVRSFHLKTDVNLLAFCLLGFHLFFILYGNISFSFCFKHSYVVLTMTNQFATTELIQRMSQAGGQNGKVLPNQNDAF